MPQVTVQTLLKNANLPSFPPIYLRLEATIDDPRSSASSISDITNGDPVLAAQLLKIANSSLFQFPSQILTIPRAIQVVGMQQIRDLALGALVIRLFDRISPDIVSIESFWRHSIACGIAARVIAAQRREANVEKFCVAGLLHDVGSLLMYAQIPDQALMTLLHGRDYDMPLYRLERQVLGFDHAELGGALLGVWSLPESLQEAVACHHAPETAINYPMEAAVVHVADIITNALQLGSRGEFCVPPLVPEAWRQIGLPESVLAPLIEQVERQFDGMYELLCGE
jgi:HD-like signal output (HDOD) protein